MREVAFLQEQAEREAEIWKRNCEAQIAPLEAEAWKETSVQLEDLTKPRSRHLRYESERIVGSSQLHETRTMPKSPVIAERSNPVREGQDYSAASVKFGVAAPRDLERKGYSLYDTQRVPKAKGAVRDGEFVVPTSSGLQDYPPPRSVIPLFDGDPLSYWTFVPSFETHIAQTMSSDPAKLVYLLQHCTWPSGIVAQVTDPT